MCQLDLHFCHGTGLSLHALYFEVWHLLVLLWLGVYHVNICGISAAGDKEHTY